MAGRAVADHKGKGSPWSASLRGAGRGPRRCSLQRALSLHGSLVGRAVISTVWAGLGWSPTVFPQLHTLAWVMGWLSISLFAVAAAFVLWYMSQPSSRASQAVATLGICVWNLGLWSVHFLDDSEPNAAYLWPGGGCLMGALVTLNFELQPAYKVLCLTLLLIEMVVFAVLHPAKVDLIVVFMCCPPLVGIVAFCHHYVDLCDQLNAEQAATKALVKMTCDAGLWLAADGDTVVRGDDYMDDVMGARMEGGRLSECLAEADRARFRLAAAEAAAGVQLLPVTLLRRAAPAFGAELFCIAVSARAQTQTCFLVGLRISEPWSVEGIEIGALPSYGSQESSTRSAEDHLAERSASSEGSQAALRWPEDIEACSSLTCAQSCPRTLASRALEPVRVQALARGPLLKTLLAIVNTGNPVFESTLRGALALCCDHARGGALLLLAEYSAFTGVFGDGFADEPSSDGGGSGTPMLRTSDNGYMTARLRGVHVSDARFSAAFGEFTEHSDSDRWPADHPDPEARGLPKDGGILLDAYGFRLKCSAKVLGLPPPRSWQGVGTKHEAALASAWAIEGCVALVRSDSGSIHAVVRDGAALRAYRLRPRDEEEEEEEEEE